MCAQVTEGLVTVSILFADTLLSFVEHVFVHFIEFTQDAR